jgi:hypothetical protein
MLVYTDNGLLDPWLVAQLILGMHRIHRPAGGRTADLYAPVLRRKNGDDPRCTARTQDVS